MFRQFIFLFFLLVSAHHAVANQKANELRQSMYQSPDSARVAILVNIAKLFQYENVDSSLYYAQLASEKGYSSRQYFPVIEAQTLMSQIALEKKDYTKATNHRRIIRDLALRERLWDIAMDNYNMMAQTWLLRNNYAEAVEELKRGLEIAIDRSDLDKQKYYYQSLVDSYRRLGRVNDVYEYFTQLMNVNEQIVNETYNDFINGLQNEREEYRVAAEEARVRWQQRSTISKVFHIFAIVWAVLASAALVMAYIWFQFKFKNDTVKTQLELRKKSDELELLIRNQENSFRFLANHVQTNINSIEQNISRFEVELGNLPVAVDNPLSNISNKIYALLDFFKNFTLLLRTQSGQVRPVLSTVNIPQMATNLIAEYKNKVNDDEIDKRLINEVQNNTLAVADEILMDIVLRNLTTNAINYIRSEKGSISIGAKIGTKSNVNNIEDTEFVEIWVADDGIGLFSEQAETLFTLADGLYYSGDPEIQDFGLRLAVCKAVIETMNGRIWAETKPNEGFCVRFCLPRIKGQEVNTLNLLDNTQEIITTEDILLLSE